MVTKPTKAPVAAPRLSQNYDSTHFRPPPPEPDTDPAPPRPPRATELPEKPSVVVTAQKSTSELLKEKPRLPEPDEQDCPPGLPPRLDGVPPPVPDRSKKPVRLYENASAHLKHDQNIDPSAAQKQELKRFAISKKFTEEEFHRALEQSSGIPTDTNIFMATLLSVSLEGSEHKASQSSSSGPSSREYTSDIPSLKSIVLDGSNIAMTHGNGSFSFQGIKLAVEWFEQRGHNEIKVVLPRSRKDTATKPEDIIFLEKLSSMGNLIYTPITQTPSGGQLNCYDDRFILDIAADKAVVVSNDLYRDLAKESPAYWDTIAYRLLGFTFSENRFMLPDDPLGKRGPTLDRFLRQNPNDTRSGQCPYGRKCTYGSKCRYTHHERTDSAIPSTIPVETWKANKLSKHDQDLERFRKRVASKNMQENLQQYQQKYPLPLQPHQSDFSNHPSNFRTQPTVISRCIGESGTKSSADSNLQPATAVIPGSVKLHVDTSGYNVPQQSAHNGNMMMRAHPLHMSMPGGYPQTGHGQFQQHYPYPYPAMSLPQLATLDSNSLTMSPSSQATTSSGYDFGSLTSSESSLSTMESPPSFLEPTDPRYNLYFHLKSLFPENLVRHAMVRLPSETDPQKICRVILELSSQS